MNTILHITQRQNWELALALGQYQSESLDTEGFIHCSTFEQVLGSANRFFKNQKNLVILVVDVDRVQPEIRFEGTESHNLFPHIYGKLNVDAVVKTIDFNSEEDGSFLLPLALTIELAQP